MNCWMIGTKHVVLFFIIVICCGHEVQAQLTDKATGLSFPCSVSGGWNLLGVGVRTKGPIKVYSVGCYSNAKNVKQAIGDLSASQQSKKALALLQEQVVKDGGSFLLKFNFKVGAEKISTSITDAVSSRYKGKDVDKLKDLIREAVETRNDGVVGKGSSLQFDCKKGVKVSLNGKSLGSAVGGSGLSKAMCNVYLDGKCASPALRQSCLKNNCLL